MAPFLTLSELRQQLRGMGHADADDGVIRRLLQEMRLEHIVLDNSRVEDEPARPDRAQPSTGGAEERAEGSGKASRARRLFDTSGSLSSMSISGSLGERSLSHSFRYSDTDEDPYDVAQGPARAARQAATLSLNTRERLASLAARASGPGTKDAPGSADRPDLRKAAGSKPVASPFRSQGAASRVPQLAVEDASLLALSPQGPGEAPAMRPRPQTAGVAGPSGGARTSFLDTSRVETIPGTSVILPSRAAAVAAAAAPRKVDRVARNQALLQAWGKDPFLGRNGPRSARAPDAGKPANAGFAKHFSVAHKVEDAVTRDRKRAGARAVPRVNNFLTPEEQRRDSLRWEVRRKTMAPPTAR